MIGRPLDVRMQILLGPAETADSLCLSAEVIYGDSPIPGSAVAVTTQRSTPDAELSARVQVSRAVNEPFVYVNLRAGCTAPFARQYVFLADPATDEPRVVAQPERAPVAVTVPSPSTPGVAAGPSAPNAQERAATAAGTEPANSTPPTARLRIAPGPDRPAAAPPARTSPPAPRSVVRRPPVVATAPSASPGPRLQLDPLDLDLTIERSPTLRLSESMLSQPTDSEETRAAARSLWQALNASPEDILRDAQKLSVLEAEIQGLRAEEAKNSERLAVLSAAADRARYLNWLVFLLVGLLLVAVAGLVWLWRRQAAEGSQASRVWWSEASKWEKATTDAGAASPSGSSSQAASVDLDLDVDSGYGEPLDNGSGKSRVALAGNQALPEVSAKDRKEFSTSAIGGSRSVATEELFDVQQQADFFVSLGEVDQAIQVLLNHLAESFEPSPLAYLDLFKLYHRQNRRADYEHLRTEFNELFNAGAPPFDLYSDQSRGLESYEAAFSRIQALWPEPRVLDVIEQSIFRDAGVGDGEVFDLEAYRELLLLHAMAKDLVKREVESPQSSFRHTKVQPLQAAGPIPEGVDSPSVRGELDGRNTVPMDDTPPASANLGLDIDLAELDVIADFETYLPEVHTPVEPTARSRTDDRRSGPGAPGLIDFDLLNFAPPEDDTPGNKGGNR